MALDLEILPMVDIFMAVCQLRAIAIIGKWYQKPEEGSLEKKWIMGTVNTLI